MELLNPSTGIVYVTNYLDGTISVVNPAASYSVATVIVGANPLGVAIDSSGLVYVANFSSGSVSVIHPTSGNSVTTVGVGFNPGNLTYDRGAGVVVIGNYGSGSTTGILTVSTQVATSLSGISGTQDVVVSDSSRGETSITGQGNVVSIVTD